MNFPFQKHRNRFVVASAMAFSLLFVVALGVASAADNDRAAAPAPAKPATTVPTQPAPAAKNLFDGKTLTGWKITDFAGHGEVEVKEGRIILGSGIMTGITWTNDLPRTNYEVSLEAMRVEGSDFFCALTFPVGKQPCSFIVGGWGGGVVGLSSLDGQDAANNETTKYMNFENGRWFQVRLRVSNGKIEAWIDAEKVVDVDIRDKTVSIRLEVEESKPLGIASWSTTAALRNIKLRRL
jgi:hypothetical protein